MATAKIFTNFVDGLFTPKGGDPIPIGGITSFSIGDADDSRTRAAYIEASDLAGIRAHPVGMLGEFTVIRRRESLASCERTIYTLANAIIASNPVGGSCRQFGKGLLTLIGFDIAFAEELVTDSPTNSG